MSFKEYLVERYGQSLFKTSSKDDADKELEPGTNIHCYENGEYTGTYGCVMATQVDTNRQIEYKEDPPKRKIAWQ